MKIALATDCKGPELKHYRSLLNVDDLIATGGTALAAVRLIEKLGASAAGAGFVVDLPELGGLQKLRALGIRAEALVAFEGR